MTEDNMQDFTYVLVKWPETQELMDLDWFDKETSLADFSKFGSSAYFIPQLRWLEVQEDRKNESDLNALESAGTEY